MSSEKEKKDRAIRQGKRVIRLLKKSDCLPQDREFWEGMESQLEREIDLHFWDKGGKGPASRRDMIAALLVLDKAQRKLKCPNYHFGKHILKKEARAELRRHLIETFGKAAGEAIYRYRREHDEEIGVDMSPEDLRSPQMINMVKVDPGFYREAVPYIRKSLADPDGKASRALGGELRGSLLQVGDFLEACRGKIQCRGKFDMDNLRIVTAVQWALEDVYSRLLYVHEGKR